MDNQNKELGFKSYFHKRSGTHFMPKGNLPSDDLARNMNKLFGLNIQSMTNSKLSSNPFDNNPINQTSLINEKSPKMIGFTIGDPSNQLFFKSGRGLNEVKSGNEMNDS